MKSVRENLQSQRQYPDPVLTRPYYFEPAWGDLNRFWNDFWFRIILPVRAELAPTAVR